MQCFENRHCAERDCTIVYAYRAEKHTTRIPHSAQGQRASCPLNARRGFNAHVGEQTTCRRFLQQVTELFTEEGVAAERVFFLSVSPSTNMKRVFTLQRVHMNLFISLHIPQSHKSRPPVCADISEHVTHGSWNCNLHFDRMHFIFSCVISNRCLRVLISVPRSLLLLTWETDTFLNAYNCREERTRPFDLSCGHTGFQRGKLDCTEVLQCFRY